MRETLLNLVKKEKKAAQLTCTHKEEVSYQPLFSDRAFSDIAQGLLLLRRLLCIVQFCIAKKNK